MKKPRSLAGFLRGLVFMADTGVYDLRGSASISETDYHRVVSVLAALQNEIGDINDILEKFGHEWPPKQ